MSDITVLVAATRHPVSGRPVRSRSDGVAAALALGLSDSVRLLSAGDLPDSVARDYLALGAPRIEVLECDAQADVVSALLPSLQQVPWVLTGTRLASEHGTGVLPHALAAALGRPVVVDVLAVQAEGEAWIVTQALPKGARRRLRVYPPAVLAVSAAATQTLRHSLACAMAGQIMRQPITSPEPAMAALGQRVPGNKRRPLLEARSQQSGHARMMGAIESPSTGGTVLQAGTPHSKAQVVLDYLRAHSLVPF
jgi:electron transfer flavoprotein beta subunit